MTPNNQINTAIDNAASRITNAKPSTALRANVMSRIAAERPSRFSWRYLFAGGAVAGIGLAAFLSWPSGQVSPKLAAPGVVALAPTAKVDPTAPNSPTSPEMSVNAARIERTASFTPSEADLEWSANAPPALERPEPLERVKSLEMKLIDNITPLAVTPLVVPTLGDDGSNR